MDADSAFRLSAYFALILLSGFFSGSETAMFSLGPVQLLRLAEERHPRAALLRSLLEQPRKLIATIFIGNEFVNIGASALLASSANRIFTGQPPALVAVGSTLFSVTLILLFGEITPKNIAARIDERWALAASRPIWLLSQLMAPLRWAIERVADCVIYVAGPKGQTNPTEGQVGEEEFRTMVDVATRAGDIDQRERELIENVFDLGDRSVRDVMTPVEEMFMLSYDLPLPRLLAEVNRSRLSRIPIFRKSRDSIVGILNAKDLVAIRYGITPAPRRLDELLRPAFFTPEQTKCERLMREFRRRRVHQALVVNEYGALVGLATMEDLLEEVFGEIKDEKEMPPPTGEHLRVE